MPSKICTVYIAYLSATIVAASIAAHARLVRAYTAIWIVIVHLFLASLFQLSVTVGE
jgi:hypothetical protein